MAGTLQRARASLLVGTSVWRRLDPRAGWASGADLPWHMGTGSLPITLSTRSPGAGDAAAHAGVVAGYWGALHRRCARFRLDAAVACASSAGGGLGGADCPGMGAYARSPVPP